MSTTTRATRPTRTAGISDAAVEKATGKTWKQWVRLLDREGARELDHKSIARLLATKHSVPPWWSQMVTVGYEQAHGRRVKHQTASGFQVSASRTVQAPLAKLYEAWADEARRARWLPRARMAVRKATANKSMRIAWGDGTTSVEANFCAKGRAKSQVAVQHNKLEDERAAAKQKLYWTRALERCRALLED